MSNEAKGFRIEVFRPGTFKPMVGDEITYSADDLAGIAESYDPESAPAPIVIGHPKTDDPAFGWVSGFEYDAEADRLYADIGEVEPTFADAVRAGRYKKVSMSFHLPDAANNPTPGKWYAKHVGFLGGAAPAVSGLKPVQFAETKEGETVTFEAAFGEAGFEQAANMFRDLRDWFIEKFDLETADKILPSYRIEWLGNTEITPTNAPTTLFSETQEEPSMTPEEIAAEEARLKAKEAKLDTERAAFAESEATRRAADHAAFADELVDAGKLLPASKDGLVSILNALPADQNVSFSEGTDAPLGAALMDLLKAQPKAVDFSEADLGEEGEDISGDGQQIAAFASAYQKEQADAGNQISISEAVEHVSKGTAK